MILFALLFSCTDAEFARMTALGQPAHITCWSGGQVIYDGHSTGKVEWLQGGGAYWKDSESHKMVETFADCIFEL